MGTKPAPVEREPPKYGVWIPVPESGLEDLPDQCCWCGKDRKQCYHCHGCGGDGRNCPCCIVCGSLNFTVCGCYGVHDEVIVRNGEYCVFHDEED